MPKIMVVAGEVSGDMQAARVIRALQERTDQLSFVGMGGEEMRKAGVKIVFDPTQLSTIGFVEAIKHLRKFYDLLGMLSRVIDEERPDLLFLVDYSAFNMKMAKMGQKKGIPVIDYFSPSAWVWGKWRAKKMARYGAKIAAVFPMEEEVYRKAGADVTFVGHPLLDFVRPELTSSGFRNLIGVGANVPLIGLLPGSRRGEITSLLPPMLEAARLIHAQMPEAVFVLPVASPVLQDLVRSVVCDAGYGGSLVAVQGAGQVGAQVAGPEGTGQAGAQVARSEGAGQAGAQVARPEGSGQASAQVAGAGAEQLPLVFSAGHAYEVMANSEIILCASGTATLEAACIGAPMVIVYQTSKSTYGLSKILANVDFAGLPNIIAGREIVPELLQEHVTGANIAARALAVLHDPEAKAAMQAELQKVRQALGATGAVGRVADLILQMLAETVRRGK